MSNLRIGSVRVKMSSLKSDLLKSSKAIYHKSVYPMVLSRFELEKNKLLEEFDNHPITQQMYAGADDPSINYPGGPLNGIGNLFSFLGFLFLLSSSPFSGPPRSPQPGNRWPFAPSVAPEIYPKINLDHNLAPKSTQHRPRNRPQDDQKTILRRTPQKHKKMMPTSIV